MHENNYSKREQDEWRNEVRELFADQNEKLEKYDKTISLLSKVASTNSGLIAGLQVGLEEQKKATKVLVDIKSFAGVTKWITYTVIGAGVLYSTVKGELLTKIITYLFK
jgi:hypothetical protein